MSERVKTFTLEEMKALHTKEQPNVMFEYFMENYCNKLLETTHGLKVVEVVVSPKMKWEYKKTKLEKE